jgi:hypothetical protein
MGVYIYPNVFPFYGLMILHLVVSVLLSVTSNCFGRISSMPINKSKICIFLTCDTDIVNS